MRKETVIELNGKEYRFCLPTGQIEELEKREGKPLLTMVQDMSVTNVVSLLKYMRRYEVATFGHGEAEELFDELTDNGFYLDDIYTKIIRPVLENSKIIKPSSENTEVKQHDTPLVD